jgi:dTDP-4-dehydrorhamnose reductase
MLVRYLHGDARFAMRATLRNAEAFTEGRQAYRDVEWTELEAETASEEAIARVLDGAAWAINAIGLIKQRIVDSDDRIVEQAVRINTLFSFKLARAAAATGVKVLQVATDCVFSGSAGGYTEQSPHDCHDVYGKTKSIGELSTDHVHNLRCSIVGPERASGVSLLNWFLTRERGVTVNGFTNHRWNGITTLHFSRICSAVMTEQLRLPHVQHVVPADAVTKDGLLRLFARSFGREDIVIRPVPAAQGIDRTLATIDAGLNAAIWAAAGFGAPPTIARMVQDLADSAAATGHEGA